MQSTDAMDNSTSDAQETFSNLLDRDVLGSQLALYMAVSLMAVIIIVGGVGNIMVILAVRTTKKLQTVSNAFVVNLSVCDLVFVMVILPFNIYTYLTDGWHLPLFLCKIIGFLGYTLTGTTIITITLIAWNRYKLVVDSQNYTHIFCRRNMAIMLALAWVMPMICLVPAVMEVWGRFGYVTMMVTCNLLLDHDSQSFKLFLLIVRAVIPCFLILFYYISIYRTTKASHRRVRRSRLIMPTVCRLDQMIQRKEMHLTKMMGTIFIVFALSYFPCTISSIVDWNTVLSKRFHMFCLITVYVGSAINPLIYGLMNSQFRCAYYAILLCRCCCSMSHGRDEALIKCTNSSPTPSNKIYTKVNKRKRSQLSHTTKQQTNHKKSTPAAVFKHLTCPPDLAESSSENQDCTPSTKSTKKILPMCWTLSQDCDLPSPHSSPDLSRTVHCTETQKTCLGDCDPEQCKCRNPFIV